MVVTKHQQLLKILNNENTDTTLAGFWHHFVADEQQQVLGYRDPEAVARVVKLQQEFYDQAQPGYTKIMSDNFFLSPSLLDKNFEHVADLAQVKPIAADDPWITTQVAAIKEIVDHYHGEIGSFYNIFSPWYQLRLRFEILDNDTTKVYRFFEEDPVQFKKTLAILNQDLKLLVEKLIKDAGIDGIYLCVQQPQDADITIEQWQEYIKPSEIDLLKTAQQFSENNVLHICGYAGKKNDLNSYTDYPFKAVNWATHVEDVALDEGKALFNGRAVLGGFANTAEGIFYQGNDAAVAAETKRLINVHGAKGLLVGADCSIPFDTPDERIKLVATIVEQSNR